MAEVVAALVGAAFFPVDDGDPFSHGRGCEGGFYMVFGGISYKDQ